MKYLILILFVTTQSLMAAVGVLPSWSDGANKQAIIQFVEEVTTKGSPKYVEVADRIATFDNDGTLWSEVPTVEVEFTKMRMESILKKDPQLIKKEPYKTLAKAKGTRPHLSQKEIMEIFAKTHTGMTEEQFAKDASAFLKTARHPKLDIPYTQTTYKPMLELISYLKENDFEVFICSGGDTSFMRVIATEIYGIPSQNIIGTNFKDKAIEINGKLTVVRTEKLDLLNDKDGKPVGINRQIGKRPILAAGNERNGGDIQHLKYSSDGKLPSLQLLINHDDAKREFQYAEEDNKSLTMAKENDWKVISIKNDWKEVFSKRNENSSVH